MPPKARITKELIVKAGFELVREFGGSQISARAIAQKLGCSTQPVLYHFKTVSEIRQAVYQQADRYHTAYITGVPSEEPMKEIGLRYIRFAAEEPRLFRLLFQSNEFSGRSLSELIDAEELAPVLSILCQTAGLSPKQAKELFRSLFLFVHGYASMLANNSMEYDEETVSTDLERLFRGAVLAAEEEGT